MKLNELITVLSSRISYDILDSKAEEFVKWEDIDSNKNFYKNYGNRKIDTIMPLDKDIIKYHVLIKLK